MAVKNEMRMKRVPQSKLASTKEQRLMEGAEAWIGFYRANPHRFVEDYLHIDTYIFQDFIIEEMNECTTSMVIGSRGISKTFIAAIFCCVRCILYPGTKICIASGTRGQSLNIFEKINLELKPRSPELAAEIDEKQSKINGTDAKIVFRNSSYVKIVTAANSARGNRANILLLDEFWLVSKDVIDTILRKFLTLNRMPPYTELSKAERKEAYSRENNKIIFLSSAYMVDHWSYTKCQDTFRQMLSDRHREFVCGLPYQLSLKEGLLNENQIADEMAETDFNQIKFSMEYEALWWGNDDGAFFDFTSISRNRKIPYPMLPGSLSSKLPGASQLRIVPKQPGEIRIMSADIALMSSRKTHNDATAVFINQMMPTKARRYTSNIIYGDAYEGLRTDEQSLIIRKLFDEFMCDYLVLDCAGIGLGVADTLMRDISDPDSGEVYPALSCCNNAEMASRCVSPNADKVIWAVKASAQFNSDCAFLLREGFRSGRIRLLITEYDGEEKLEELKGYSGLSPSDKIKLQMPYIHTTLLIDELVKLEYEETNGKVKISERSGMRKDRYSSLAYNYYAATQIENKINRKTRLSVQTEDTYRIRAPRSKAGRR